MLGATLRRVLRGLLSRPVYSAKIHTQHGAILADLLSHDYEPQRSRFFFGFVSPWLTQVELVEVFCGKRLVSSMKFNDHPWLLPGAKFQYSHTRGKAGSGQFVVHHIVGLRGQRRLSLN
jgi:hypothetical protein